MLSKISKEAQDVAERRASLAQGLQSCKERLEALEK